MKQSMAALLVFVLGGCISDVAGPTLPENPDPVSTASAKWFTWSETTGLTLMPSPVGVNYVRVLDMNDAGEVVGQLLPAGARVAHAFYWSPARGYVDIGETFAPARLSSASSIDDDGTVAGYYDTADGLRAFLWQQASGVKVLNFGLPGSISRLSLRGGILAGAGVDLSEGNTSAEPFKYIVKSGQLMTLTTVRGGGGVYGLNALGDAVGYDGQEPFAFGGEGNAVVWDSAGHPTTVYECGETDDCFAYIRAINNNGVAVGGIMPGNGDASTRIFRWTRDHGVQFISLPVVVTDEADVVTIKDDGTVLAYAGRFAFLLKGSNAIEIPIPPQVRRVEPVAMNKNGMVVGNVAW